MLTEVEIFDCMKSNLSRAAVYADHISRYPASGHSFIKMRAALKRVEGACRQAAYWRQDARWLRPGLMCEKAHQIARTWLHRPSVQSKKLFTGLAAALRKMAVDIERLQTARTGQLGMILPKEQKPPTTSASVPVKRPSGLILPAGHA
jgi:hypothetical protein